MDKRERRVKEEISVILASKTPNERRKYANDLEAYVFTETRKIRDIEREALLKEQNQHVYNKKR